MFQRQEMNLDEPAQSMDKLYSMPASEISLIRNNRRNQNQ